MDPCRRFPLPVRQHPRHPLGPASHRFQPGLELRGLTISTLFNQLGGFAVLAFLPVYRLVAAAYRASSLGQQNVCCSPSPP